MKFAILYYATAILFIATMSCSNSDDNQVIDEDLLNVVWLADSLGTPDTILVLAPYPYELRMWIQFTENLELLHGNTTCRKSEAEYKIRAPGAISINLWIASTDISCGDRLEVLEASLRHVFLNITNYEVYDNHLSLNDTDRQYFGNFSHE